ncbi:hypothetical protein POTOM_002474 [Populus tomentosa]|uniref:CCHC-type domain-containing protein n=1 Tax=Populus tomentosa TaxID=118781 RepID=A0A8X8IWZ5_POPTO|nr:hypothetical protein POTOM_002474 [Populus tomentosa]
MVRIEHENGNRLLPKILIDDSIFNDPWHDSSVIKLLGKNVGYFQMQSRLKSAWKLSGGFELMDIGNGYFMVKFDIAEDRERIINGGPWMIFDYYLTMQKWTADFVASSVVINRTMVWVRIPSLNLVFYDENFLPAMASTLGTPFKVDMNTLNVERGRFARICVEIELDQPAVGSLEITLVSYKVEYEGLHIICSKCGCYGHLCKDCPAKDSTQDDLPRTESEEHLTTTASGDRTNMAVEERAKVMALTGNQDGVTAVLVGNYENSITTQKSESLQFTTSLNETLIRPHRTDFITRQPSKDQQSVKEKPVADSCSGEYIYIHDLPRRFNQELIESCESITVGTERNMCPYLVNSGLGHEVENFEGVLLNKSWYSTNQFLLAVIFHNKMKQYKCLTNDSSLASAIYVPFYAGLDVGRYLWGVKASIRDQSSFDFVKWMVSQPEWKKMWGRDHFLVVGRISWDFRRKTDNESDWGSKLRFLPESNNMSMLSIESSSWNNDYAIPYPTCFHPSKDSEVLQWQDKMRRQKRPYLFSFAGAPRSDLQDSVRGKIIEECQASKSLCKLLECSYGVNGAITCDNPANVMRLFQNSVYCLQPAGDSYTRRSIFDAILAGCIPVFFHPGTAYAQYKWHLPQNYSKYSVFIPVKDVKDWKAGINETLLRIPEERVMSMREEVIRLIPSIIYADPRSRLETFEDAFDLAVKGILDRIDGVRKVIRDGGDPSAGFADGDDFKYTFSGYGGET